MRKLLLDGDIPVNCYLIENNGKCYVVDPGYEKERVIKYVKDNQLEVLGILLTHAHIDHIGAIDAFSVPVYLHKNEYPILVDNEANGFGFYGKEKPYELKSIHVVEIDENHVFSLDNKEIHVLHTPGHTVGGVCYKFGDDLYTGDTLFKGTVGKWVFPTGDLDTLKRTIVNLIDTQSEHVRIHPAHGDSSTIGEEKEHNGFYVQWKKEIG